MAEHFLAGRAQLTDNAREAKLAYAWPGNVRELKNAIERAALLAGAGPITPEQLNLPQIAGAASVRNLDEPSREVVESALQKAEGVVSRAAQHDLRAVLIPTPTL